MPFKNRQERRAAGLCARCSRKAEPTKSMCAECAEKDRVRKPRKQNKEAYRSWYYQKKYGITLDEFKAMEESQRLRCAVCGTLKARQQEGKAADCLHVDHCHTTGKVRGLLCLSCNRAAGLVKDDASIAAALSVYLRG